ncbi:PadR family transcriptional regulator [Tsukamurella soli]|uniref:PadR family transcriptional regulator n=1 Tax=Tsukamurella soli TaxID=644556 RepID=A0ABP8K155_9ACTN
MATTKRKVDNLLALAVLSTLWVRPMHRYEMASILKERGKDQQLDIKWGSFYTVVQNMEKHGFVAAVGTDRRGARPERTIYAITDAGRTELLDWTRELLATFTPEHPRFEAGLSVWMLLGPQEVTLLLQTRLGQLEQAVAAQRESMAAHPEVPRLFLIETEYAAAMLDAEADWIRGLIAELTGGTFPGLDMWRTWHETGELPVEIAELAEKGALPEPTD